MKYLILFSLLIACGPSEDEKGPEEDALTLSGKDDSFRKPTFHGHVSFGESEFSSITKSEKIHAWTFALSGPAEVTIETAHDSEVDTVLYYYKKNAITRNWGPYKKKNDDYKENDWSRISFSGDTGNYRIIVKSHSKTERGGFSFQVNCEGEGCEDNGVALRDSLQTQAAEKHIVLGYRGARDEMYKYGGIDDEEGRIEGLYSGRHVDTDQTRVPSLNCTTIEGSAIECSMNTEHTFARHFLRKYLIDKSPEFFAAESDLHHIYPADQVINAKRGHFSFGETDCDEKNNCKVNEESKLGIPTGEEGSARCSKGKLDSGQAECVIEVRDLRKGDVARAQFYMAMRYGMPLDEKTETIMKTWNQDDPPDAKEMLRNDRIEQVQGNRNPFVDDPDLISKITNF